jgi:hypothetical protein
MTKKAKTASRKKSSMRIMRVYVRPNSPGEKMRHPMAGTARPSAADLAGGLTPHPEHDLRFRGGRTIPHLNYINFFVGGSGAWNASDVSNINSTLSKAMSDSKLNNVMRQYFANQPITTNFLGGHFVGSKAPKLVTQTSAHQLINDLFKGGQLSGIDFPSTVVNLLLPSRVVLTDGTGSGRLRKRDDDDDRRKKPGTPEREEDSSLGGLGGYHGAVDTKGRRIYFAVGVFSEQLPNGRQNGIPVFDQPWKNVVGTFYHELNEARTDPDVDQAIATNRVDGVIGWNSDQGEECGDFPVFESGNNLSLVFKEVPVDGGGTAPVQFQYSNAVHGAEGPIATPHPLPIPHEIADAA